MLLRVSSRAAAKRGRAAKMVILNVDHPDIVEFIESNIRNERSTQTLYSRRLRFRDRMAKPTPNLFSECDHSVRVTDDLCALLSRIKTGDQNVTDRSAGR